MSKIMTRGLTTLATLPRAPKVICIGRNYACVTDSPSPLPFPLATPASNAIRARCCDSHCGICWIGLQLTRHLNRSDHIAELRSAKPKQPFFFLKPTSSLLLPGGGPVIRPRGINLHYEVELALIMGRDVKDLDANDEAGAYAAVESYAIGIDMTARNMQDEAKRKGLPWSMAKGFDTFLPLSNIIAKGQIPDPHAVELFLTVNGEERQRDSTELMLFRIPRILSDISSVMTIQKGDIVLTGTPKGVGSVVPGDVMRAGVKVDGKELEEGKIEVLVAESTSSYEYKET